MPPNDRTRPVGGGLAPNTLADGALGVDPILPSIPTYVVVLQTRYGMPRRRVYLDLGAARTAVERTQKRGLPAELILCKLVPVTGRLDEGRSA